MCVLHSSLTQHFTPVWSVLAFPCIKAKASRSPVRKGDWHTAPSSHISSGSHCHKDGLLSEAHRLGSEGFLPQDGRLMLVGNNEITWKIKLAQFVYRVDVSCDILSGSNNLSKLLSKSKNCFQISVSNLCQILIYSFQVEQQSKTYSQHIVIQ